MNSKLTLNLDKSANALRLALDKAGVVANVKAETAAIIDVSGSFEHEHEEGTTSILLERLVPYCMVLDPDRKMDVFTFSAGEDSAHYVGVVTPDDARDYITRNIVERVPGWNGGTTYSFVGGGARARVGAPILPGNLGVRGAGRARAHALVVRGGAGAPPLRLEGVRRGSPLDPGRRLSESSVRLVAERAGAPARHPAHPRQAALAGALRHRRRKRRQ